MPPLPTTASNLSDDYGGPYTNQHQTEDPTAEMDAGFGNQELCDVAMMTATANRAWVIFTGVTYTSGTLSVTPDDHDAQWGSSTGVRPTVGETSAGVYVITWAANQTDQLGATRAINIRFPRATAYGVDGLRAKVISWTANTVTINTFSSGSANALNGTKIAVWWG